MSLIKGKKKKYKTIFTVLLSVFLHFASVITINAALVDSNGIGFLDSPQKLYSSCVFGYESGDLGKMINVAPFNFTVKTMGEKCINICQEECYEIFGIPIKNSLKKLSDPKYNNKENKENRSKAIDTNSELINKCLLQCKNGLLFNTKKLEYSKESEKFSTKSFKEGEKISTSKSCSKQLIGDKILVNSPDNSSYNPKLRIAANERIIIHLYQSNEIDDGVDPDSYGNTVYLCGNEIVKIYPSFYSTKGSDWKDNKIECSEQNNISDEKCKNKKYWNARNQNFTDTGIYIKNGDYLSISYEGRYHFKINGNNVVFKNEDNILQIKEATNDNPINLRGDLLVSVNTHKTELNPLINHIDSNSILKADTNNKNQAKINGLKGYVIEINEPEAFLTDKGGSIDNYNIYLFRKNIFKGILSNYSDRYAPLMIRHFDDNIGQRIDNLGGYNVTIKWKGCRYKNGERLQYALVDKDKSSTDYTDILQNEDMWKDVRWSDSEAVRTAYIENNNVKNDVNVFFRIKPLSKSELEKFGYPIEEYQNNSITYKTVGEYSLSIKKDVNVSRCNGFISNYIKDIHSSLFESFDGKEGVVVRLYKSITGKNVFVNFIRLLLVLYISYTGLLFITGLSQITQKEGISRIIKISVVLIITQPYSWDFFNKHLFVFFTEGVSELINKLTYAGVNITSCTPNSFGSGYRPPVVISNFDLVIQNLFNDIFWQKFFAIIFSGFTGFIIGILILVGVLLFCICIIKVILMYVISLYCIGLLIIISPFIISCLLFTYTKKIFDAWIKQLIAFALEPILVLSAIWFFQKLAIILLQITMSFTMCKVCLLNFGIPPLFNICILSVYRPILSAHSPSFFSMPIMNIAEAICFFIIASSMLRLSSIMSHITQHIIGYATASLADNPLSQKINKFANSIENDPLSYLGTQAEKQYDNIKKVLGTDKRSKVVIQKDSESTLKNARKGIDERMKEYKEKIDRREQKFSKSIKLQLDQANKLGEEVIDPMKKDESSNVQNLQSATDVNIKVRNEGIKNEEIKENKEIKEKENIKERKGKED